MIELIHTAATWAMVGFSWTIQLLQYPAMADVPASAFPAFEANHQRRVVMVLAMFGPVEIVSAAWLAARMPGEPIVWIGGALLAAIWISTGTYYAPIHGRLAAGFDTALHARLLRSNWLRTVAWTVRGVLAVALLA